MEIHDFHLYCHFPESHHFHKINSQLQDNFKETTQDNQVPILNFSPPLGKSTHERNSPKQNQLSTQSQPTTLCGPFSTFSFRHFASSYPAFSFQTSSSHAIPESSVHKLVEISLPAFQPCSRKTPSSHLHRLPHVWSSSSSGWFFQS